MFSVLIVEIEFRPPWQVPPFDNVCAMVIRVTCGSSKTHSAMNVHTFAP
ncbi:hypothetical protein BIFPSEUDO_03537 [Bifidobacterium pseudocatenulatum DSM 20438 = JCM 1200 = LMG 10505]|uniref:Uncharacterized protein n=1 Tax=Bifidobacterium pseudocatenulatum DSM 20438 = JCM 1200 = LMG 10505 TaxID=547043 RepID=C0BT17_BIFPS|nr:hypothetical protein BIFPSEUDO_03537 [Bifidobacterium pseudocatenulatum DSM 20438 = JCM 1200 = LMG 10505]